MLPDLSRWQKIKSYMVDVLLEHRVSSFDNDLYLILRRGKLQLCTPNAVYSYEDRYYNFAGLFEDWLDVTSLPGNKVLVLGLGLGSIPQMLDKINPGNWQFTAVEIDEAVCELAGTYSLPHISSNLEVVVADASAYLAMNTRKFDLICVDVFVEDKVPPVFQEEAFLKNCRRAMSRNGLLVYNAPAFNPSDRRGSRMFYDRFIQTFPNAHMLEIHRNFMMLSNRQYTKRDIL